MTLYLADLEYSDRTQEHLRLVAPNMERALALANRRVASSGGALTVVAIRRIEAIDMMDDGVDAMQAAEEFAIDFFAKHPDMLVNGVKEMRAKYGLTLKDAKEIADRARGRV